MKRLGAFLFAVFASLTMLALVGVKADAQQGYDEAPAGPIVEIRNADFDQPLKNVWRNWLGLGGHGAATQWEVVPAGDEIALRNVATGRYLRTTGTRWASTGNARSGLTSRYLWQTEINADGDTLLRNVRTGRYLDADRGRFGWLSVDMNRRQAKGTGWMLIPVGLPPTPTPIPSPTTPPVPTPPAPTPTPTVNQPTPTPTPTVIQPTPTATTTPAPPTPTPTVIPATPTPTPTVIPATPTPTPTVIPATPTPTATEVPPTSTPTVIPATPTPTVIPATPTPTVIPATPTPTATAVPPTPTPTATSIPTNNDLRSVSGTVIDAVAASNGSTVPVVGATIRVGEREATTDNNGDFTITEVPVGVSAFEIDGSTANPAPDGKIYTDYRNAVEVSDAPGVSVDLGVFYATPRTTFTVSIQPAVTTNVGNPEIDALVPGSVTNLQVVAGSAVNDATNQLFDGSLSITQVPNCCTPSSMPQFVIDADPLIVTVQPLGISFDPPAPLSLPNTKGYVPGERVDLWSLNPDSGVFEVKGQGQVTADGLTIETISGGLEMTDWHFFVPNPPVAGQPFWNFSLSTFQTVAAEVPVSLDVRSAFTDPDNDVLTFSIDSDGGWGASIDPLNGVISGPPIADGERVTVLVRASDGALSTTRSITIAGTLRPIYNGPSSFPIPPNGLLEIDFSELYSSPGGLPLTFSLRNGIEAPPEPSASVDPVTGIFTIDASALQFGFYDFSVEATNDNGVTGPYLTLQDFAVG